MRALLGQATSGVRRWSSRILHVVEAVLIVIIIGATALFWRLSEGPLELPWLVRQLEAAANAEGTVTRLTIGGAALAWEGFHGGVDWPVHLRVRDIALTDANGPRRARIPSAEVTLSPGWLLLGRIVPRVVDIEGARLRILRSADGAITLDLGTFADPADPQDAGGSNLPALLAELAQPRQSDNADGSGRWSQLTRLQVHDASVTVLDRQLGLEWRAPKLDLVLLRQPQGGVHVTASIMLALGDVTTRLDVTGSIDAGAATTSVEVKLGEIRPSQLAQAGPALAALKAIDTLVRLSGTAAFGADLGLTRATLTAELGPGSIAMGQGRLPLRAASMSMAATLSSLDVTQARLVVAARDGAPPTVITGQLKATRSDGVVRAAVTLDLDRVTFADLPALWPPGLGGPGTRPWIVTNITAGRAENGHIALELTAPEDFSDATVTTITGGMDGHDLTVSWLRPVPPIEHGEAKLAFTSPDIIDISILAGRQGALTLSGGGVKLSGIAGRNQFADIDGDIAGPLPELLTLLRHPKIKLLDRRPIEMRNPAGQIAGRLTVARLPLKDNLSIDDVQIRANAKLTDVRLGGIAAGRDLDRGAFTLQAGNDGLKLQGSAAVAGIPAQLQVDMDFRAGGPTQEIQRVAASAIVDARQLQTLGVDAGDLLSGPVAVSATQQARRDGRGEITLTADLAQAVLQVARLNWRKPAAKPAKMDVHLILDKDRITRIDRLKLLGEGLEIDAQVEFAGGQPRQARVQRALLGPATDVHGDVRWPARPGAPWIVSLDGRSFDATAEFVRSGAPAAKPDDTAGPPWSIEAHLDRMVTGPERALSKILLHAESDGRIVTLARLTGLTAPDRPFEIAIRPATNGRSLVGSAADAGALLLALDVVGTMRGGTMSVAGRYDDAKPGHVLAGTAEIRDFRVVKAPGLAKLLQAMSIYGVLDLMQGPGLGFDRLVAPFRLGDAGLDLEDARVFNASIGMTAKGHIDMASGRCDVHGTIIPAYVFNSLLGNIPLFGRLFSPERGGGLFAATYSLTGPCDDPSVGVNPLAAVTPGFLRGFFDIFDRPDKPAGPAPMVPGGGGG